MTDLLFISGFGSTEHVYKCVHKMTKTEAADIVCEFKAFSSVPLQCLENMFKERFL